MKINYHLITCLIAFSFFACKSSSLNNSTEEEILKTDSSFKNLSLDEISAITKEAYIYAYPMADGYRIQYAYFVSKNSPEYKAPYNNLYNTARVYTPNDKAVQTPNSDTPYSFCGFDLRTEPYVLTIPSIEEDRYFSVQLIDYYTHNFDYIGSRTTGNKGGNYLIAGPHWKGETPKGISKVIKCETELITAIIRTQLFNSDDLENVKKIQSKYNIQPLSNYLGKPSPKANNSINFVKPLLTEEIKSSLEIFNILNFQLQFCPTNSSELDLMKRFAKIGIGAGKKINFSELSPEIKAAMQKGISDAWAEYDVLKKQIELNVITSGDLFGSREHLKNNYLYRMAGAILGIYGNSKEEAMYPIYSVDNEGKSLIGSNKYILRFSKNQLPPANSFWSLTMYEMPSSLLVDNPIKRYLINSPMISQLKKDTDGSITLYIQNESPGKEKESNWLPAPKGHFLLVCRIYWPKEEAISGKWNKPPLTKIN